VGEQKKNFKILKAKQGNLGKGSCSCLLLFVFDRLYPAMIEFMKSPFVLRRFS